MCGTCTINEQELKAITDPDERTDRLCEMNVVAQVYNVCNTTLVQKAWFKQQDLTVHGWIYSISDGLLRDMHVSVSSLAEMRELGIK